MFSILLCRKLRDKRNVAAEDAAAAIMDTSKPYTPPHNAPAINVIGEQGKKKIAIRVCTPTNTIGAISG
jgi:hypothetical protein